MERIRLALSKYNETMNAVISSVGASDRHRDYTESECLAAAAEVVEATEAGFGEGGASDEVVPLVRLLLSCGEKTHAAVAAAQQTAGAGGEAPLIDLVTPATDVVNASRKRSTPLLSLPPVLQDPRHWVALVVHRAIAAVAPSDQQVEAAEADGRICRLGGMLDMLRRRGLGEVCARYMLGRPRVFGEVAKHIGRETLETLVVWLVAWEAGQRCLQELVTVAEADGKSADASNVTVVIAKVVTAASTQRVVVERILAGLFGVVRRTYSVPANSVAAAVRRRVLAKFGDDRCLEFAPSSLCHAAIGLIERTPSDVLQSKSENLLGNVLSGVSARLSSLVGEHRRMACIAARCLSLVIDPQEPVDFEDHPLAYEEWVREGNALLRGGVEGHIDPSRGAPTAGVFGTKTKVSPPGQKKKQDHADDLAFDDEDDEGDEQPEEEEDRQSAGEAENNEAGGLSADADEEFWGPTVEGEEVEIARLDGASEPSGSRARSCRLQDVLKMLNEKCEDAARKDVDEALACLPSSIRQERLFEVEAVAPALFKTLLFLSYEFLHTATCKDARRDSLLALLVAAPKQTIPTIAESLWSEHMGTAQRCEALHFLSTAAVRLREVPARHPAGAPPSSKQDVPDIPHAYRSGLASIYARRPYPPLQDDEHVDTLAKATSIVQHRLQAKTVLRSSAVRAQSSCVEASNNEFDRLSALFVYNVIGTADSRHFNPSSDPMVLVDLLKYLWCVGDLLSGCLSARDVSVEILAYLWTLTDQPLPLASAHVFMAAAACLKALPQPVDVPLLHHWAAVAEEVLRGAKGKHDPACFAAAVHLMTAIQERLDEVLAPAESQFAPGINMTPQRPFIEVL
ncbi:hypothetical protein DIPPA_25639 [Diplonema papillatum]|nr:hypothetical protein DIPPA_25639 [Diplonema papillatum]|eukprot:gene20562-31668_t